MVSSSVASFLTQPVVALFVCVCLGHGLGLLRVGPIQLGGVCGTLFVALALGQLGVTIGSDLKDTAFALFIFALGFTAGPQFFANIRSGWRYGIFSVIEVVTVLAMLAVAVVVLRFDPGTTAGLFAGSATESAVLGTAAEALSHLALPADEIARLQANLATAYGVTYLFGLVGIVVFTTQIAPLLLRVDLKDDARRLAHELGADDSDDSEQALPTIVGRAFRAGPVAGMTIRDFENSRHNAVTVERIKRGKDILDVNVGMRIEPDDILFLIGRRSSVIAIQETLGDEVPVPVGTNVPIKSRNLVLVRRETFGLSIRELHRTAGYELSRGVFISEIRRLDRTVPVLPGTRLEQGDVLTLYGTDDAIDRAIKELGHPLPPTDKTDFIFLGAGIVAGIFLGALGLRIGALNLSLGTGGGALIAGLLFGWLHMHAPRHGALPTAAAEFMKDFGLATFIAAVGLSAGPEAIALIMRYGAVLPILGLLVSVVPAAVSLLVGTRLLRIEAPILLGAIAGQHCSTPTITALVAQSGSTMPVVGYTVTYAISNVLLPLMGPVVVGLATSLP
ncbi:aspartate-alanine antiporter [Bradyrhizobium sp. U87765 SZCCT0131]|uniref:aspartate-alanine antiporter n=1 Tax=unclassified Bradyrhizobium TaxID=2631580 RepID=UPI001BA995AF|nr:aspartate-alanine antiporter [Bradyrhizobium sp. U87765 SZCCT0131]MBR1264412.1 aspartate-alanine antiporter [Bradyrhizobium sp. U87765 SZCCT0134]MBR1304681.1 aspartate-alanine antiporter [Bradyrhizobium sp. U87765 SZCCT0110]MBR1322462.1 aspartate-alanine antiporter [Bradyrhizobium sp. U87765 SZCCT0109]MBR1346610.1 aspartate-alanine antiporter [Bradyrhizobium sp. U87765 SZCCT0048]